jgi:hypothetical protein
LEAGFNNIKDVRVERVRPLEEVITDYLVGYRLRYRSATFAEYALGHVSRLLGGETLIDIDDRMVLSYQESRLRENAAPKSINEEVRFLLKDAGRSGRRKAAHLAAGTDVGLEQGIIDACFRRQLHYDSADEYADNIAKVIAKITQ